jgi:hypothetical protein
MLEFIKLREDWKKNMGRVVVANLAHKAFEFSLFKSAHTWPKVSHA